MEPNQRNRTRKFKKHNYSNKARQSIISPGIRGGASLQQLPRPIECVKIAEQEESRCKTQEVSSKFDHPDTLQKHLGKQSERAKFIYGIGVILQYKHTTMKSSIESIEREISKLNEEYVKNEKNYQDLMEDSNGGSASEMKDKLQESVREKINSAYETKFSELLIKKQAYDVVLKGIENRRWYIVQQLQENGGAVIFDKINEAAADIYKFYRGPKYTGIRSQLYELVNTISTNPALFRESFALNASIVGPAGSGKTTMARKIAKWYAVLGILTYDAFYEDPKFKLSVSEVSRANLIGEYTGQTAPKTLGVLAKSLEKTLFIDEAYSVSGCSFDADGTVQADAYGDEFIATLLLFMNDHKGYSSIIVAGYENQMEKCFFARNEGLPRRFPNRITLPFYATDELFGMFLTGPNGVNKKMLTAIESDIDYKKANLKKKEAEVPQNDEDIPALKGILLQAEYNRDVSSFYKFRYLTVMKPSFLMVHNDTTYDAVEILRKYLVSIQLRIWLTNYNNTASTTMDNLENGQNSYIRENVGGADNAPAGFEKSLITLNNIYSYTILAQVLINLFDSDTKSARKHLFRRLFYRDVYNFESQNLSNFPAQSGEMENLVDSCIMNIGSKITDDVTKQTVIGICDEELVMNSYLVNKKLQVELYKKGDFYVPDVDTDEVTASSGVASVSTAASSLGTSSVASDPQSGSVPAPAAHLRSADTPVSSPRQSINHSYSAQTLPRAPSTGQSTQPEKDKYFMELNTYNAPTKNVQKRIFEFFELDKLFNNRIPSLHDLYLIFNVPEQLKLLTEHVMNLYLKKVSSEYLQDLASLPDNEFPIHILRKHLEQEILDLKYVNEYKPIQTLFAKPVKDLSLESLKSIEKTVKEFGENPDFKKLVANASKQRAKLIDDIYCYNKESLNNPDLRHPKLATFVNDDANLIKKGDVLYEDLGFSLDVDSSKIDTAAAHWTPNFEIHGADFGLEFLHLIEPRLFARTIISPQPLTAGLVEQKKEEEKAHTAAIADTLEESALDLYDIDIDVAKNIDCKCLGTQAQTEKNLTAYMDELAEKLREARRSPLNADDVLRLKAIAEVKKSAEIKTKLEADKLAKKTSLRRRVDRIRAAAAKRAEVGQAAQQSAAEAAEQQPAAEARAEEQAAAAARAEEQAAAARAEEQAAAAARAEEQAAAAAAREELHRIAGEGGISNSDF